MAGDVFIWIDTGGPKPDVHGETTDDDMKKNNAFEVLSWSFGAFNAQTIGSATHGAGAGKGEYTELVINKNVDKASTPILQHTLAGTHFKQLNMLVRRSGGTDQKQVNWMEIVMQKVYVSNYSVSGSGTDISEGVSFASGAVEIKYYPQKADGSADKPIPAQWSKITNKPELKVG